MGCGKSSIGKELSALLSWPFTDTDDCIQEKEGRSISDIFASDGEAAFRKIETEALENLIFHPENQILSLGGGTITTPECAAIIKEKTVCIYLRATTDTLVKNLKAGEIDKRPMLHIGNNGGKGTGQEERSADNSHTNPDVLRGRIEQLISSRAPVYESTAHIIVDTDGKQVSGIAAEILHLLYDRRFLSFCGRDVLSE